LQERLRGLLASAAGVGEIDVRLNGIRARQPVLTGLQPIEHRAIVGNQDDQILTRVDRLCFKGALEGGLEIRCRIEPGLWLANVRRLNIRRREDSIDKSTRTVRVQ
jgi:hypothetical protein